MTEFHWLITLQFSVATGSGTGTVCVTSEGTHTARPGETRQAIYRAVYSAVVAQVRASRPDHKENATLVFFALEPNQLGAGASR